MKELTYLHIGGPNKLEMRTSSNLGEQEFWDSLPINEPQVGKNTPLRNTHTEFWSQQMQATSFMFYLLY
jgi:hypothetical protein